MEIEVGHYIKQKHWADTEWYLAEKVEKAQNRVQVLCPSGVKTHYPLTMNWEVLDAPPAPHQPTLAPSRQPEPQAKPKPAVAAPSANRDYCTECLRTGLELLQEGHGLGCSQGKPYKHAPLPPAVFRRFPTHPSDILIHLNELQQDPK